MPLSFFTFPQYLKPWFVWIITFPIVFVSTWLSFCFINRSWHCVGPSIAFTIERIIASPRNRLLKSCSWGDSTFHLLKHRHHDTKIQRTTWVISKQNISQYRYHTAARLLIIYTAFLTRRPLQISLCIPIYDHQTSTMSSDATSSTPVKERNSDILNNKLLGLIVKQVSDKGLE